MMGDEREAPEPDHFEGNLGANIAGGRSMGELERRNMEPIIPTMLSPTEAAAALGIEVVDLAVTCRERASQKLGGIANDIRNGHALDQDELHAALNLVAAAEACDEVWLQDNPEEPE